MKEFADDNVKFNENGRKLSKWIEKTVGKGEIACDEQFLLFPQCFQRTRLVLQTHKNRGLFGKGLICQYSFCHLQILSPWTSLKFGRLVKGHT